MNATKPIEIDGEEYPYYSVNLSILSRYINFTQEGSAALRLVPTRIDKDGNSITREDYSIPVLLGSALNLQEPEKTTVQTIYSALQNYIFSKNFTFFRFF